MVGLAFVVLLRMLVWRPGIGLAALKLYVGPAENARKAEATRSIDIDGDPSLKARSDIEVARVRNDFMT
jgi:hypothetical protein